MNGKARKEILRTTRNRDHGRGESSTPAELRPAVWRPRTTPSESTLRTEIVSRRCANPAANHGTVYANLERAGRGIHCLAASAGPS